MMIMTSSNKDIHTTKESFVVAAASYFGWPDGQVMRGSTVEVSAEGTLDVVLRVSLTPDDLTGIAGRMKAMAEEQVSEPPRVATEAPTREELREQYNALSKQERSRYGSFYHYVTAFGGENPYGATEIVGKVELPAHVYLSPAEATPQQKAMAIGQDEKGRYAIAVEDLTEEQRAAFVGRELDVAHEQVVWRLDGPGTLTADGVYTAPPAGEHSQHASVTWAHGSTADQLRQAYVERTMAARERLNGADGRPTSNADDIGGVLG